MPSIEGGGVEKNLFIITNYLSREIKNIKLITADKIYKKRFSKSIELVYPKKNILNNSKRLKKYIVCLFLLLKILLKNNNYVVFAFQANLYCTILCKLLGVRIIVRSNSSPSGWSKNIFKKYMYYKILNIADKVIVNSNDFKRQFKEFFSVNAKSIYNPLNKIEIIKKSKEKLKFPFFTKNKNCLKIINIGRFTDQKDHLTLLKSVNLIKFKVNFRMLIIGRGVNKEKINNFIKKNNLKKKIKVINFQSNPFKFIKKADIFILSSRFEGLPNVLLEAIALKKFVISTNCPTGPREILSNGKGGELVKVGDYNNLSKKILLFNSNKKKMQKKINYSYKALYRFDYLSNLKEYLSVVKTFIN